MVNLSAALALLRVLDDYRLHADFPYWLYGAFPLAVLTGDEQLTGEIDARITHILQQQRKADGWLGPDEPSPENVWARFYLMLTLIDYHLVHPTDERILPAVLAFLKGMRAFLETSPMVGWAQVRQAEMVSTLRMAALDR